jgi:hypothetical protein
MKIFVSVEVAEMSIILRMQSAENCQSLIEALGLLKYLCRVNLRVGVVVVVVIAPSRRGSL